MEYQNDMLPEESKPEVAPSQKLFSTQNACKYIALTYILCSILAWGFIRISYNLFVTIHSFGMSALLLALLCILAEFSTPVQILVILWLFGFSAVLIITGIAVLKNRFYPFFIALIADLVYSLVWSVILVCTSGFNDFWFLALDILISAGLICAYRYAMGRNAGGGDAFITPKAKD